MKKKKNILVRVSALALLYAPAYVVSARAQTLKITCTQNIDIGNLIASGCAGKYVIAPTGATSDTAACLIVNNAGSPGRCSIKVTGGKATKSATVIFAKTAFTMVNSKDGNIATMKSLLMQVRSDTPAATKLTLGTSTLSKKVVLDIGGTVHHDNMETGGTYSGKVSISVNFN